MTARLAAVALAAAVLAAPAAVSAAAPTDAAAVRAVLVRQANLVKRGDWRAMYATYTPRFRKNCPYARFVAQGRQTRQLLGTRFQIRGIQVRLETASRAIIAYRFVRDGRTIAAVTLKHRD